MAEIKVTIEGARNSDAEYDEDEFLRAEQKAADAIGALYGVGARIDNIEQAVQMGLEEAEANA